MKQSSENTPGSDTGNAATAPNRVRAGSWLVLAGACVAAAALFAERQPYDRYSTIVDRQMFGPLPDNFDPTKSPSEVSKSSSSKEEKELTKEQEKVKSAIRFSVINVTPEGETAIGFTDNSDAKKPVHYYLKVGESRNGWLVKEADAKTASMTIEKDGIEVTLSLGGDSAKGAGKTESSAAAAAKPQQSSLLGKTLGLRRRMRREREAEELRKTQEEHEKKLKAEREKWEAERQEREAENEAQRQAEREEQKKALQQLRDEIRKTREQAEQNKQKQNDGDPAAEGAADGG